VRDVDQPAAGKDHTRQATCLPAVAYKKNPPAVHGPALRRGRRPCPCVCIRAEGSEAEAPCESQKREWGGVWGVAGGAAATVRVAPRNQTEERVESWSSARYEAFCPTITSQSNTEETPALCLLLHDSLPLKQCSAHLLARALCSTDQARYHPGGSWRAKTALLPSRSRRAPLEITHTHVPAGSKQPFVNKKAWRAKCSEGALFFLSSCCRILK